MLCRGAQQLCCDDVTIAAQLLLCAQTVCPAPPPQAVADIIRTTLGPRSMLKMLLDANGSIVLTNDGHAILREIDVTHPAAKSMIQLSRTQDEEVGDGTTSVIILAGELLQVSQHQFSCQAA